MEGQSAAILKIALTPVAIKIRILVKVNIQVKVNILTKVKIKVLVKGNILAKVKIKVLVRIKFRDLECQNVQLKDGWKIRMIV